MASRSFDAQKAELDEACEALRTFTLGRRRSNQKSGMLAIERVNALCERMKKLFATSPHSAKVAAVVASVRGRVAAAEARLALLARKLSAAK